MSEVFQMKTTKAPHIVGHSSMSETPSFLRKKKKPGEGKGRFPNISKAISDLP